MVISHPGELVKGILCLQSSGVEVTEAAAPGEDRWLSSDKFPLGRQAVFLSNTFLWVQIETKLWYPLCVLCMLMCL